MIAAGLLLLLAVVAYLINDAENLSVRMEAAAERQALDAQTRRSIAEMKALRDESERIRSDRESIHDQHEEILESLNRIEDLLSGVSPHGQGPGPGR